MSKRRYPIHPQEWLDHLAELRGVDNIVPLKIAMGLYNESLAAQLEKGLGIADILLSLGLDTETLAATLAYPALQSKEIHLDSITDLLGESSSRLLHDVLQMQSLEKLQYLEQRSSHQIENLRKMLLAMVTDVRAVLVVLAERLWQLRQAKQLSKQEQELLANETLAVFAPLANRLGIWQLKWEIEDLCLRCLHPDSYMQIAKGISARRDDREAYIERFMVFLSNILEEAGIRQFQVTGRVKHIYSIYRKMQRKSAHLEQIYDMSALRVLVQNVQDCYAVLSILQNHWQQIPEEFDDYISHPKPNGYRSIHTVVIGPHHHNVEIQIRTYQMHQESELGVAAHWRYKEGVLQTSHYEAKIALLRQIMAWQKEVIGSDHVKSDQSARDLFADRIYVFTPTGDIVDLPKGATPLDFAYHIHSEVGHRCRGAKVDGNIVPLTYPLQMGERIEILTAKQANPSRDWLSPHLGFLKTARARAKVQHWFRVKDSIQHAILGRELLEKELKKAGLNEKIDLNTIANKCNYKTEDDLLAGLGAGDIRFSQILHHLQPAAPPAALPMIEGRESEGYSPHVQIPGINNLMTHIARCCKPLPGDAIVGYVTRNRGVSIHRHNCNNMMQMATMDNTKRMIEVSWGEKKKGHYPADLFVRVFDRPGMLRDVAALLAGEKINVLGIQTQKVGDSSGMDIYITIEIENRQQLKTAIDHLKNIPNVVDAHRR
jgi:GTP pyrophosphokinase